MFALYLSRVSSDSYVRMTTSSQPLLLISFPPSDFKISVGTMSNDSLTVCAD